MKAYCLIRPQPHYRHDAFVAGLTQCGYDVELSYSRWPVRPSDVLVIWNRYGDTERIADGFEAAGGTVLVAENGYIGKGGASPKSTAGPGNHYYALARHAHNGRGNWPYANGPELPAWRWDALGIEIGRWRARGDHVLVCANRSFGMSGGVMPHDWAESVATRLKQFTKRSIRIRLHPGNLDSKVSLEKDLESAHACVIWSSSCGVHALVRGIPVISEAQWWICKRATFETIADIEMVDDTLHPGILGGFRTNALKRLAWAQWSVDEIASGEPFRYLLSDTRKTEGAAVV